MQLPASHRARIICWPRNFELRPSLVGKPYQENHMKLLLFHGKNPLHRLATLLMIFSTVSFISATALESPTHISLSPAGVQNSGSHIDIIKRLRVSDELIDSPGVRLSRHLATVSGNNNPSGTGWIGLQAITAFFVIIAVVAFALFLRPTTTNRSQYQPV